MEHSSSRDLAPASLRVSRPVEAAWIEHEVLALLATQVGRREHVLPGCAAVERPIDAIDRRGRAEFECCEQLTNTTSSLSGSTRSETPPMERMPRFLGSQLKPASMDFQVIPRLVALTGSRRYRERWTCWQR